ncbi:MAG: hypothetical protein Q9N68_09680 [Gammaproteobacteria bacterium]|nr:hypothetical protein [Gammaproteobacteria bacterium]
MVINKLTSPPESVLLRQLSFNEPALASRLLSIWLQDFDYQYGQSLSYEQLNYTHLINWLDAIQELDADNRYPLLSASHLYSNVNDSDKLRQIIAFVAKKFEQAPAREWSWMVKMVLLAQHKLHDAELALRLSQQLMQLTKENKNVPRWVKQMTVFILAGEGEKEAAATLIAALLKSGEIKDPAEQHFLEQQFIKLQPNKQ